MRLSAEMIIPKTGEDDYGQEATATSTFLRYSLELANRSYDDDRRRAASLEIVSEELVCITQDETDESLLFPHSPRWRDSWLASHGRRVFISTERVKGAMLIALYPDAGAGRPSRYVAEKLPRTVLSGAQKATESPTALLVRREMQSWRLLQLEPAALRRSDRFDAPERLEPDGSGLAATLYRLDRQERARDGAAAEGRIFAQLVNRLSELLGEIADLWVDRDEKRQLLTLYVKTREGTEHPASVLSEGTLRFLALAALSLDTADQRLICLEEPENGIHPGRLYGILGLLQDTVVDVTEPVGHDNPFRQVIINTHSAAVVQQVPEDSLLIAVEGESIDRDGLRSRGVSFQPLPETWRTKDEGSPPVSLGMLLGYLNPVDREMFRDLYGELSSVRRPTVIEREDIQQLLPFQKAG